MKGQLKFGTSGLRDTVENMTDMECYINTRGFIYFLEDRGELGREKKSIATAGDMRSSTPRILSAVAKAILDTGYEVVFCGNVPTPTLAYYAMGKNMPSIMVTGSHIPDDRNGIKFTKVSGEVLKSDEKDILKNVLKARAEGCASGLFNKNGMFSEPHVPLAPDHFDEAVKLYIKRYTDFFTRESLKGMKIVLYQHSAVGRDIIAEVLKELGAEVVPVGRSDKFVPVDTEKISERTRVDLEKWASEFEPFTVVSTDGDSDRPLVADEKGNFIPGDKLGALVSIFLEPDFAAIPVSANDAVVSALSAKGIKVVRTKIGSPYVVKAMMDQTSADPGSKAVSWESNGGFLTGSDWSIEGRTLRALPTRDALLPILAVLILAGRQGSELSELVDKKLPKRYTGADVIDKSTPGCAGYNVDIGKNIIEDLSPSDPDVIEWFYDEKSANDVPSENNGKICRDIKEKLEKVFNKGSGFDEISSVNFIDGVRVSFKGGDVIHLRPSGNAPEFRIYSTADTGERAAEIVESGKKAFPEIITHYERQNTEKNKEQGTGNIDDADKIIRRVSEGLPLYVEPYQEPKVWGINGIGEYWYGAEPGDKSSMAVFKGDTCSMEALVEKTSGDMLGDKVLKRFGKLVPLVKILTPKGRLSVQFHDSKNELWIVTNIRYECVAGDPRIIVGFSKESVEKHGKNVIEEYGKALKKYGAELNSMIEMIEKGPEAYMRELLSSADVLIAADRLSQKDPAISGAFSELLRSRNEMETFYNYRTVKPGDVIPIPSGTLHALGAGIEVVEPQIPGPTQSLEDGGTFPVRYYFPGHKRPEASKQLDLERINEMYAGITPETLPEVIDEGSGYSVERLPGDFGDKGLEVRRLTMSPESKIGPVETSSLHSFVAIKGDTAIVIGGEEYPIPKASAGGSMLLLPATSGEYSITASTEAAIIDTFTPVG